jgi:glycosyltransferase involved in cell wall biosynthesis
VPLNGDRRLLRTVLRLLPVQVVNLHYSVFGIDEHARAGVPIVYTVHNAYVWSDPQWVKHRADAYHKVSAFIAVSEPVREFFVSRFGVDPRRVRTVPNGLDLEHVAEAEAVPRAELGLAADDVVFVNVAAVNWYKFHLLMVAAMEKVVRRCPRAKLLFVGPVQDPTCLAAVRKAIAERELGRHVRLLDYVPKPRVLGLLDTSDCFLLPSLVEGWSIAAMEAMYAGLPLIMSDVGSARAVIRDGDIGRVVRNPYPDLRQLDMAVIRRDYMDGAHLDNLDELVEAMLAVCDDREGWRRRGAAGRARIVQEYSSVVMGKAYAECFREYVNGEVATRSR